jgi:hypothetical protein
VAVRRDPRDPVVRIGTGDGMRHVSDPIAEGRAEVHREPQLSRDEARANWRRRVRHGRLWSIGTGDEQMALAIDGASRRPLLRAADGCSDRPKYDRPPAGDGEPTEQSRAGRAGRYDGPTRPGQRQ